MSNEELVSLIKQGVNINKNTGKLYVQNKGMIYKIVNKYRYACQNQYNSLPIIEIDELMHEAYFGLLRAIEGYDSSQGSSFMSYAAFWIRQSVKRYIENCGQVVRVPVHRQQQIYQYNEATSYYLQHFHREPYINEYARWLGVSEKVIIALEKFMFQGKIKSLDSLMPWNDDIDISLGDIIASDSDIENDIIEKLANEQLKNDLWNTVEDVLKDEKLKKTVFLIYRQGHTLKYIGDFMNISPEQVRQYKEKALKKLRNNSKTRHICEELGFLIPPTQPNINFDTERIKRYIDNGYGEYLDVNEVKYANSMGWISY